METIAKQLDALFNSSGRHFEALTYAKSRDASNELSEVELKIMQDLLTALAPFRERLLNLKDYDV